MNNVYNFSAGPAVLPSPVLERLKSELPEFRDAKASVMEISHRGVDFMTLAKKAEQDLRDLEDSQRPKSTSRNLNKSFGDFGSLCTGNASSRTI